MIISALLYKLREKDFIAEFCTNSSINEFKRYIISGVTSFIVEYTSFYLLNEKVFIRFRPWGFDKISDFLNSLGVIEVQIGTYRYLLSNTIVYIIIFWLSFTLNRIYSFKSRESLKKQLKKFGILFVINLFVTSGLLYLFTNELGFSPYVSKVLVMFFIVIWNFIIYKKIIYK